MTVYTTVNVQHLESLNDVVAQITGVRGPGNGTRSADRTGGLCQTDPPLRLTICSQRLKDGKVYVPQQIQHAIQHFFHQRESDRTPRIGAPPHGSSASIRKMDESPGAITPSSVPGRSAETNHGVCGT